jgi:transcriptional regulator with XRE-family HTH domain
LNGRSGFGPRLRAHRERRGITLTSIAESTKIKRSLLEALERGDVSQWPQGLYRRAYIREYACAIGLAPEPLVEEFQLLFPENGGGEAIRETSGPLRITLAGEPKPMLRIAARSKRAAIELGGVVVLGGLASLVTGSAFLTACGSVALLYYPLSAIITGRTPDPRQLRTWLTRRRQLPLGSLEPLEEPSKIYVVADELSPPMPFVHAVGDEFPQHHASSH